MAVINRINVNGVPYDIDDTNSFGKPTEEGGVILTDCDNDHRAGKGAIAAGFRIGKSGAEYETDKNGDFVYDENGEPVPLDERDWRYNEAIGTGSEANGMGAVAYSRASKSLGYRTQTGYPPSVEEVEKRSEAVTQTDENGNVTYPEENVGQAAVAIGADTVAVGNHSLAGGHKSQALKHASFAFGREAKATQVGATAFGQNTTASGEDSFASGNGCVAGGAASVAMGKDTTTGNAYTAAFGVGTTATRVGSLVCGQYNSPNGAVAFAVGMGTAQKPANAFQVRGDTGEVKMNGTFTNNGNFVADKNGNVTAKGKLTFSSIDANSAALVRNTLTGTTAPNNVTGSFTGQLYVKLDNQGMDGVTVYMWVEAPNNCSAWHKIYEWVAGIEEPGDVIFPN